MKIIASGLAGITFCQIPFNNKSLELCLQLIILIVTIVYQRRVVKNKKEDGNNKG